MRRKILVLILSLSIIVPFAIAEEPTTAINISDIQAGHWADGYAHYLVQYNFMKLSGDGKFFPDRAVTRAEMIEIIMLQTGVELVIAEEASFADVDTNYPLYSEIETAYKLGIIKGVGEEDGTRTFRPDALITRSQFVKIILEANSIDIPIAVSEPDFPDVDIADWKAPYVHAARELGFINGYADGNFGPDDNMTRAQVAKVVYLFLATTDRIVKDIVVTSQKELAIEDNGISAYDNLVLSLINASRNENNKQPLILDKNLSLVARHHAEWLANNSIKSSHTGEGGSSPFDRLRAADIEYAAAAENVGWSTANAQDVTSTLMAIHSDPVYGMMSEPADEINHRTNILGIFHNFNKAGIGVVVNESGGSREVRVVQLFVESMQF